MADPSFVVRDTVVDRYLNKGKPPPTPARIGNLLSAGRITDSEADVLRNARQGWEDARTTPRSKGGTAPPRKRVSARERIAEVPFPKSKAMRWVLLAVLILWVVGNVREIRRGVAPSPTVTVGAVVLAFFLAVLAELSPKLAASFAGLIIVSALLSGPDAIQAIAGAATSRVAGRRLEEVRAGTRPDDSAFTRPGFIGPPTAEQVG